MKLRSSLIFLILVGLTNCTAKIPVQFSSSIPEGNFRLISERKFQICQERGINHLDFSKCKGWKGPYAVSQKRNLVGNYQVYAWWPGNLDCSRTLEVEDIGLTEDGPKELLTPC